MPLEFQNRDWNDFETCRAKDFLKFKTFPPQLKLKIAIIGAGVGGLATAIALKQDVTK